MRARRKRGGANDEVREFTDFGSFAADKQFVTTQVALKIASLDNRGATMTVDTDNGVVKVFKGDMVIKTPNGSLFVMKAGVFNELYEQTTSVLEIEDLKQERQRVCQSLLTNIKDRGITTFNKLEDLIRKWAGETN